MASDDTAGTEWLQRFVAAQEPVYEQVLSELAAGRKASHWMWFVFPQWRGLGRSATARHYGIATLAQAQAYARHALLGPRLEECTRLVLGIDGSSALQIFGTPDDLKFCSSMTLFERAVPGEPLYGRALERFYGGRRDPRTLEWLGAVRLTGTAVAAPGAQSSDTESAMSQTSNSRAETAAAAEQQRRLQSQQNQRDAQQGEGQQKSQPVQAGAREQPTDMPAQHLEKPGSEAELQLQPRFMAPDYQGSKKLDGKVALITGGDSGIGRAVAVLYAREGAKIAIVYLEEDEDAEETRRCVEAEGSRCKLLRGDVKDPAFCREAVQQTIDEYGQLDVLVNNAGFQEHASSLEDLTDERFDETLRTNVYGYFHMARAALPHLQPGSSIINTGSVTGLEGSAHLLDYSTTKGAIHAFTKALAQNVIERGIRVNAVAPGPVWTPLNPADSPPEKIAKFGKDTDMKRAAQPEELSPAYVFLAAPVCSSYITGIVLPVTGSVGAM